MTKRAGWWTAVLVVCVCAAGGRAAEPAGAIPQVVKGTTTQDQLVALFGGPNLTSVDPQGREVWVYERSATQTDTRSATSSVSGGVDFSAFWSAGEAGAHASAGGAASAQSTASAIRTVTVYVTFGADHTVLDYTVRSTYY